MLNFYVCDYLMGYPLGHGDNMINVYDIRKKCVGELCYDFTYITDFLNRKDVQRELGVQGRKYETCNVDVYNNL